MVGEWKYYLSLTGYFCSYTYYYAQLAEPLQTLKTSMLKLTLLSGQQQSMYTLKTQLLPPSSTKLAAFQSLPEAMSKPTTLIHYNSNKILWINLMLPRSLALEQSSSILFQMKNYQKGNSLSDPPCSQFYSYSTFSP